MSVAYYSRLEWNLSITDTLGPEKQFVIQRFPLLRGYFICTAIYQVPQKQSVIERFPLLGEFVIRGSTAFGSGDMCLHKREVAIQGSGLEGSTQVLQVKQEYPKHCIRTYTCVYTYMLYVRICTYVHVCTYACICHDMSSYMCDVLIFAHTPSVLTGMMLCIRYKMRFH